MKFRILLVAGLLGSVLAASDANANWGGGGRHHSSSSGSTSGSVSASNFNNGTSNTSETTYKAPETPNGPTNVGVPEPSALFALSSALVLLGATGWVLRRKE